MTVLASLAAATFLIASCGSVRSSAENAVEKATGCEVDSKDAQASIECKDGKGSFSVAGSAEIPDSFPAAAVPLPDGKLISAVSTETNSVTGYNLSYTFTGSLDDAAKSYRDDLRAAGFTIDDSDSFSAGDGGIVGFSAKGDGWEVSVIGGGGDSDGDSGVLSVTVVDNGDSSGST